MDRIPFYSSGTIRSAGWENNVLEVEFVGSGAVYQFKGVSRRVWEEFKAIKEKGNYFQRLIRGRYEYACVSKPQAKPAGEKKSKAKKTATV